jgi:hypothetical protein
VTATKSDGAKVAERSPIISEPRRHGLRVELLAPSHRLNHQMVAGAEMAQGGVPFGPVGAALP